MMEDRSRNQMRKIGDEKTVFDEAPLAGVAAINVGKVGDLGKGEERDTQGQHDGKRRVLRCRERIEDLNAEIRVFVESERSQVDRDRSRKQSVARLAALSRDQQAHCVIEHDGDQDDRDKMDVPVAVEGQRRRGEPAQPRDRRHEKARKQEVSGEGHRKEQEQKLKLREEHNKFLDVAARRVALPMITDAAKLLLGSSQESLWDCVIAADCCAPLKRR